MREHASLVRDIVQNIRPVGLWYAVISTVVVFFVWFGHPAKLTNLLDPTLWALWGWLLASILIPILISLNLVVSFFWSLLRKPDPPPKRTPRVVGEGE